LGEIALGTPEAGLGTMMKEEISPPGIEPRFSGLPARSLVAILPSGEIHWYFKTGLNTVLKK
jgi:hypothetical protein